MGFGPYRDRLAARWPFAGFVVIVGLLMLASWTLLLKLGSFWRTASFVVVGVCWAEAMKARLVRLGLLRWHWAIAALILFVPITCLFLIPSFSVRPTLVAALFVLLHVPLIVLKDKPHEQGRAGPALDHHN